MSNGENVKKKKDRSDKYNVAHLGLSFLLIFLSFHVSQIFQTSSDHAREGAIALAILYGTYSLSSFCLSSYITRLLGVKLTLILSSLIYVSFVAVNVIYNRYLLYTIASLLGLGSSLIWTAQGVYVSLSAMQYQLKSPCHSSAKIGSFHGLFFSFYQLSQTIGFGLASLLFYFHVPVMSIFLIMTGIGLVGTLSLTLVRPVDTTHLDKQSIFSSITLLKESRQLFVVPLICYTGFHYAYFYGVFPPLIISKSLKFFVYATYGLTNSISSFIFGKLSDSLGKRIYLIAFGGSINLLCYLLLLSIWSPPIDQRELYKFFFLVNCFAVADGILLPQTYSILTRFFGQTRPSDVFSNFKLFQTLAISLAFLGRNYFTFSHLTFVCIISLLVSLLMLIICHFSFYSIDNEKSPVEVKIIPPTDNDGTADRLTTSID